MVMPKRVRSCKANANMSDINTHIPKIALSGVPDKSLLKLVRLAEKIRKRADVHKYVFGGK